jgi:Spy/CpxP family protein refolding chaperone
VPLLENLSGMLTDINDVHEVLMFINKLTITHEQKAQLVKMYEDETKKQIPPHIKRQYGF